MLKTAALAGQGLVCLPTFILGAALESGRLVTVLDDCLLPPLAVRALYPHNRLLSAKVRAFVDFLAARFARELPEENRHQAQLALSDGELAPALAGS